MSSNLTLAPPISRGAVAALGLGLASCFFGALAGLPALYVGLLAVRAINLGAPPLRGMRLAVAGMVLGGLTSLVTLAGVGAVIVVYLNVRANRAGCINNLRQLGMGTLRYSDAHADNFPRAALPNANLPPEERLSWVAGLLPYLGEVEVVHKRYGDLSDKIDRKQGWAAPANATALNAPLTVCLCPSHPHFDPRHRPGLTHYVGLSGVGPRAAFLPTESGRAGIFGYDRRVRVEDLIAGRSCTMLLVETAHENGPWLAGGHPTVRELAPDETHYVGLGRPFGGLHPGGLNVLWADASVRWTSDRAPADDFRALATLAGKPEGPEGH